LNCAELLEVMIVRESLSDSELLDNNLLVQSVKLQSLSAKRSNVSQASSRSSSVINNDHAAGLG
jgi:hypothetical protein